MTSFTLRLKYNTNVSVAAAAAAVAAAVDETATENGLPSSSIENFKQIAKFDNMKEWVRQVLSTTTTGTAITPPPLLTS